MFFLCPFFLQQLLDRALTDKPSLQPLEGLVLFCLLLFSFLDCVSRCSPKINKFKASLGAGWGETNNSPRGNKLVSIILDVSGLNYQIRKVKTTFCCLQESCLIDKDTETERKSKYENQSVEQTPTKKQASVIILTSDKITTTQN